MPEVKFLKDWAGRKAGTVEGNPDPVLCKHWVEKGVVEIMAPAPTEDRAMRSPPRGRRSRRSEE